jgi:two-component system response regulator
MNERAVLLVEDNPSDVDLMKRAFRKARISNELVVAQDGEEAMDYVGGAGKWAGRDVEDMPALALVDLKLPGISGIEVVRRIRRDPRTRRLPVVILTSSREEQDLAAGYDAGVNSYLCKPVDFSEFAKLMENLGLYWLLLNERPPEVR